MRAQDIDRAVEGCTAAHRGLADHLGSLLATGAIDGAQPSLLPGWTVSHVLAHLAANADSHVRVLEGAARGEVLDQYEGGFSARNAGIEDGARMPVGELVAAVGASIGRLESAWSAAAARGWQGRWRSPLGPELSIDDLPFRRWREVEIHHYDLGLAGFGIDDWSPGYVTRELALRTIEWSAKQAGGAAPLPAAAQRLSPNHRLAWLMGRAVPEGLEPVRFG